MHPYKKPQWLFKEQSWKGHPGQLFTTPNSQWTRWQVADKGMRCSSGQTQRDFPFHAAWRLSRWCGNEKGHAQPLHLSRKCQRLAGYCGCGVGLTASPFHCPQQPPKRSSGWVLQAFLAEGTSSPSTGPDRKDNEQCNSSRDSNQKSWTIHSWRKNAKDLLKIKIYLAA